MIKKSLIIVLTLAVLLAFAVPCFARWGPKPQGFGPVVLGHPWGDCSPRSEDFGNPGFYRPNSGAGFQGLIIAATTSFTVQFYVKYVASKKKDGLVSVRYSRESD